MCPTHDLYLQPGILDDESPQEDRPSGPQRSGKQVQGARGLGDGGKAAGPAIDPAPTLGVTAPHHRAVGIDIRQGDWTLNETATACQEISLFIRNE